MIKTIQELGTDGNITVKKVMACNKCGRLLEGDDYHFDLKVTFGQVIPRNKWYETHYVFEGGAPEWHLCSDCFDRLSRTLDEDRWHANE